MRLQRSQRQAAQIDVVIRTGDHEAGELPGPPPARLWTGDHRNRQAWAMNAAYISSATVPSMFADGPLEVMKLAKAAYVRRRRQHQETTSPATITHAPRALPRTVMSEEEIARQRQSWHAKASIA